MARNLVTGEYVGRNQHIHRLDEPLLEGWEMRVEPVGERELDEGTVFGPSAAIEFRGPTCTACPLVSVHNPDGDKVGWLDWQDGKLTFGGDMAESARMFFEYFKCLVDAYFETVCKARMGGR